MHRFILDNDGTNFFLALMTGDIEASIDAVVARCPSGVTTYMLCAGAGTYLYPTRVGEITSQVDARLSSKCLRAAIDRGMDPFGMLIDALRGAGKETFITLRMNDVHDPKSSTGWNTSRFKRENPGMMVDPDAAESGSDDWLSYCLDYSKREVRDYFLAIIRELAEMYEIDGLQLDWMRFPRHLSGESEEIWRKRDAITEFTSCARDMLKSTGKRIMLSARIPTSLTGCRRLGLDIAEWTRLGLVDFLTASPFLTTDFAMPIHGLRAELGDSPTPIYGAIEFGHSGYQAHCPESLCAAALGLYDSGADGVYVFNFPCWTEYLASVPYHWLEDIVDGGKSVAKPLLFSVAHTLHRLDVDQPGQLPAPLPAGGSVHLTLPLPQAALPAMSALVLVHSYGDVELAINGQETEGLSSSYRQRSQIFVEHVDPDSPAEHRPEGKDCRLFRTDPSHLKAGINNLTVHNGGTEPIIIRRVNLGLW